MILKVKDWRFLVDKKGTLSHTTSNASDHCLCGYCKNYYDTVSVMYPNIKRFLADFGVNVEGPSELMPFEPTLFLACYRVQGKILHWGQTELYVDGIAILPEIAEDGSFLLWVGEMELPWVQKEPQEDIISPANLPEFLERMREVWQLRHACEFIFS